MNNDRGQGMTSDVRAASAESEAFAQVSSMTLQRARAPTGTTFAGLDAGSYPGQRAMDAYRAMGFAVTSLYFNHAPARAIPNKVDNKWIAAANYLRKSGWGLAPIYVGAELAGSSHVPPPENPLSNAQTDAAEALDLGQRAGFQAGSTIFLDVEKAFPKNGPYESYALKWIEAVQAGGYYVRCFGCYPKQCSRIHLFASDLNKGTFDRILGGQLARSGVSMVSPENYQGFIVVKPLPQTVVGRSCLRPPLRAQANGVYPTLIAQRANLYGMDCSLNSLPFQEQDHEVAACATSALWSVLHGTARLFDHSILSPLEITRTALSKRPLFGRALPNDGLDIYQMAGVVRHVGLEADVVDATERYLLQACA